MDWKKNFMCVNKMLFSIYYCQRHTVCDYTHTHLLLSLLLSAYSCLLYLLQLSSQQQH